MSTPAIKRRELAVVEEKLHLMSCDMDGLLRVLMRLKVRDGALQGAQRDVDWQRNIVAGEILMLAKKRKRPPSRTGSL